MGNMKAIDELFLYHKKVYFHNGKKSNCSYSKIFPIESNYPQSPQISLMYIYSLIFSLGSLVSCLLAKPWNTNFQRHEENNPCLAGLKLNKVHRLPLRSTF